MAPRTSAERHSGHNAQPWLYALGAVLGFLLLNIEIADFSANRHSALTFQFSETSPAT